MKCAVARVFYKVYFKNGFWSATIHLPLGKASSLEMGRPGEDVWVASEHGCGWGRGSHRDLLCTLCPRLREVWQHGAQARSVLGFLDVRRLTDGSAWALNPRRALDLSGPLPISCRRGLCGLDGLRELTGCPTEELAICLGFPSLSLSLSSYPPSKNLVITMRRRAEKMMTIGKKAFLFSWSC